VFIEVRDQCIQNCFFLLPLPQNGPKGVHGTSPFYWKCWWRLPPQTKPVRIGDTKVAGRWLLRYYCYAMQLLMYVARCRNAFVAASSGCNCVSKQIKCQKQPFVGMMASWYVNYYNHYTRAWGQISLSDIFNRTKTKILCMGELSSGVDPPMVPLGYCIIVRTLSWNVPRMYRKPRLWYVQPWLQFCFDVYILTSFWKVWWNQWTVTGAVPQVCI
jgi:hypothetical protein